MELSHFTLFEIPISRINLINIDFLFFLIFGKGFHSNNAANHNVRSRDRFNVISLTFIRRGVNAGEPFS